MADQGDSRKLHSVSIHLDAMEGRIEEIHPGEGWLLKLRVAAWDRDQSLAHPLELSEEELIDLLQKAIRAGILSPDFVKNLSAEFEI